MPLIETSRSKNILHENSSENLLNGISDEGDVQKENKKNLQEVKRHFLHIVLENYKLELSDICDMVSYLHV